MSTIYNQLSKEEQKLETEKPALLPTGKIAQPSLAGIKFGIFAAFVLSLAALAGAGFLYQSVNTEKRQRLALESVQLQLEEKAAQVEKHAGQYRAEMERMREQLKSYGTERGQMKKDLEVSRIEISNLQKKIQVIEGRSKAIEEQAVRIQSETDDGAEASPSVSVPDKEKEGPEAASVRPSFQVMTVNRKFNFAVVNMGIRDGLKMGEKMTAERGGKSVGSLQVEKLYDNFAAAAITEEPKNALIQEGDLIRRDS